MTICKHCPLTNKNYSTVSKCKGYNEIKKELINSLTTHLEQSSPSPTVICWTHSSPFKINILYPANIPLTLIGTANFISKLLLPISFIIRFVGELATVSWKYMKQPHAIKFNLFQCSGYNKKRNQLSNVSNPTTVIAKIKEMPGSLILFDIPCYATMVYENVKKSVQMKFYIVYHVKYM